MATSFPTSLDTAGGTLRTDIASTTDMDASGFEHDVMHVNVHGAALALEAKVGTGASTPVADAVLMGTGTGTSAWDTSPTFKGAVTVGEDDVGHDVKFFGATATNGYLLWDESEDDLILGSASKLGLGATSPSYPLHISTTDNRPIGIVSSVAGSYLDMRDTDTTGEGYVSIGAVGDGMNFIAGGTSRMTINSNGQAQVATFGNSNTAGFELHDTLASSVPPFMEVFGDRSDANSNAKFSARLMLTKHQTNAAIAANTSLGGIWFGGCPDYSDDATRVYPAGIMARADDAWTTGAGNQATELRFFTGSTGIAPQDDGQPGSTAFYINAAGNCGMATTTLSSDAVLSLSGDSAADYKLMFQEGSADVISLKYVGSAGAGDSNKFQIYDDLDDAALLTCDLAGRFAIGTTAPTFPLQVVSSGTTTAVAIHNSDSSANSSNSQLNIQYTADGNCTGAYFIKFADSAGTIGSVTCASTSSVAFNTTSDYRTKENVTDLTGAVDLIKALRPINYTFIRDPLSTPLQGFLAHEVAEVVPQAISGEKDAMRTVPAEEGTRAVVSEPATYVQAEVTDENGDPVLDEAGNPTFVDTDEIVTPAVMVKETFEISPAHEVEDHQQIDYGKLVPVITGAIKELDARLTAGGL